MPEEAAAATPATTFTDPYRNYNFRIEIPNVSTGYFTECSCIGIRIASLQFREAGNAQVVHQLPGRVEYADMVLRYGLTASMEMWNWFLTGVQGKVDRRNISIILIDADGVTEAARWNLIGAWAKEWRGAALDTLGKEVAIETLVLAFESLERG